ncbi:MAG TPA: hypothetical protein PLD20_27520 [Blastocatellia bacterium]|nr:hypothetical protein [Blastocatellia bacterium]HMX28315.1 hypothetical protein [Blastocatellia bacterium]HMZ21712.1 hypothetical protein [Blastocatellia bacterium]HNG28178.1 hypothetical protein [Blastocatellia bacterium]
MKPVVALAILFFALGFNVFGQIPRPDCRISQISTANHSLEVHCTISGLPAGKMRMQFTDDFAGVDRLSERLRAVNVTDERGGTLPLEIRGNGLYLFDGDSRPLRLTYEMRLARAFDPSQFALVSGIGTETAVLMTADLLPRFCLGEKTCAVKTPARLAIETPAGWQIATTEPREGDIFNIADASQAVFFLGRLREQTAKIGEMNMRVAVGGEWAFRDAEVFSLVEAVVQEQALLIGGKERGEFLVTLAPFPQPLTGLRSSAVTIGQTVVLLLNPNNDAAATFKHYRRHLAHETFHFYLPNAFRIRENFDWFWEGFTRYAALLTLARLRMIDLREYLNAVHAEYEAYLFNPLRTQVSLLAASPEKFAGAANSDLVYRKGMLVAALYDLELRRQSRGKLNLTDVMKTLYRDYALAGREVGNREILQELNKQGSFARLIRDHIEGVEEINLPETVKPYGLVIERSPSQGNRTELTPARKLTDRQRELFRQLIPTAEL